MFYSSSWEHTIYSVLLKNLNNFQNAILWWVSQLHDFQSGLWDNLPFISYISALLPESPVTKQENFPGRYPKTSPAFSSTRRSASPKGPCRVFPRGPLPQPNTGNHPSLATHRQTRAQHQSRAPRREGQLTAGADDQEGGSSGPPSLGEGLPDEQPGVSLHGFYTTQNCRKVWGVCCWVSREGARVGRVCSVPGEPTRAARDSLKTGQPAGVGRGWDPPGCPDCPHSGGLAA